MECGIDIVEISRIEKSMQNGRFIEKYFSKSETELFKARDFAPSLVAGNFAAKEAFSKALRTGVRGFLLKEIEVLRDELGAPYFSFQGQAKTLVSKKALSFSLSISHTKELVTAMVIAY